MKRLFSLLIASLFASIALADKPAVTDQLAIDANEDSLTATLTYRGATVDIWSCRRPVTAERAISHFRHRARGSAEPSDHGAQCHRHGDARRPKTL